MPSETPLPRPLLIGAAFAVVLGFGALAIAGFNAARGAFGAPRPASISIIAAVAELRTEQAAARRQAQLADQVPSLMAAKEAYVLSAQALDAAWNTLAPDRAAQLTGSEWTWIRHKRAACAAAPAGATPDERQAVRLACETAANRARTDWLKPLAAGPAAAAGSGAKVVDTAAGVCALLHARADHVGQAVAFRGEYLSDHQAPAEVRPLGCDAAIVVGDAAPAVEAALERADPPPWTRRRRRIVGSFSARLVQSGAEFSYDAGVRLSISGLSDLQVTPARRRAF